MSTKFWVERFHSSIQKLNFGNSKQKGWRSRYETFSVDLILLNLIVLLKMWPGLSENFLLALETFKGDLSCWKKCSFGSKNYIKELPISKPETFSSQILSQTKFAKKYTKIWIWKMQWMQKCEDWRNGWMLGNWSKLMLISFCSDLDKIFGIKSRNPVKLDQPKNFDIYFCNLFDCWKRLGTGQGLGLHPDLRFLRYFQFF